MPQELDARARCPARSGECPGFTLLERQYDADRRMAPHAHDIAKITLVLSGRVRERGGRSEFDVAPGDVAVKPSGAAHADHFGPRGLRTFSLRFPADTPPARRVNEARYGWVDAGPLVRAMTRLLAHHRDTGAGLVTDAAVWEVLAALSNVAIPPDRRPPAWLRRARERLHDKQLVTRVRDLADECGVHPVYLTRRFKHAYGVGVSEYVQRLRARRAARLLATEQPLAVVALEAGFADQAHMTRSFRRRYGVTPARYRELMSPAR